MATTFTNILKGGFQLSLARVCVLILSILQSFVLAKVLGPSGYGEVSLFSLILLYGGLTSLGFDTVAMREIPGHIARNDTGSFHFIKNFSFTVEMGFRLLVCLIVFAAGCFFYSGTYGSGVPGLIGGSSCKDRACFTI